MVETNDPDHRQMNLTFSFDVRTAVEVRPSPYVNLFGVQGDPLAQTLIVRRTDGQPLELKSVTSSEPSVRIVQERVDEKNADPPGTATGARPGDIRLKFSIDSAAGAAAPRRGNGTVNLTTNHPKKPELSLPLSISVQPLVRAVPPRIEVQRAAGSSTAVGRVSLAHGATRAFRVTAVEVKGDLAGCTARLVSEQATAVQVVEVLSNGEPPAPGTHTGTLVATTNLPLMPVIEVPVVLRVTAPPPPAPGAPAPPGAPAAGTRN